MDDGVMTDGWRSRKLWLTVLVLGLILWGYFLCGHPKDLFGQFCMALLTASGLYKAASVYEKLKGSESADAPAAPAVPAAPKS